MIRRLLWSLAWSEIELWSAPTWAAHRGLKKMVVLRMKVSGMWLFYNLILCVFFIGLLGLLCVVMVCYGLLCVLLCFVDN